MGSFDAAGEKATETESEDESRFHWIHNFTVTLSTNPAGTNRQVSTNQAEESQPHFTDRFSHVSVTRHFLGFYQQQLKAFYSQSVNWGRLRDSECVSAAESRLGKLDQ